MAELGALPHVIKAILNHQSGHRRGGREKRAARMLWADHMLAAVEGRESNVVSLSA
jgi:hypothetical protein